MKWHECDSCAAEFRVVSDTDEPVSYCPYCGAVVESTEEDDDFED
jgi:predicted nucleic acid-binding Zn ribbon protein